MASKTLVKVAAATGFAVFLAAAFAAQSFAFNGPSSGGGTGSGFIGVGAAGNVSIGTSTASPSVMLFVVGSSSDSNYYAIKVQNSSGAPLFIIRNDGTIAVATGTLTTGSATFGDNVFISGTLTASNLGASTINANNVSAGTFASSTGGGNFSFPGNVGIGTTSPSQKLDVVGNGLFETTSGQLQVNDSDAAKLVLNNTAPTTGKTYQIRSLSNGQMDILNPAYSPIFSANATGYLGFGNGVNVVTTVGITLFTDATTGGTLGTLIQNNGAGSLLRVQNSSTVPSLMVLNNGNVGIGTTTPAYPLTVAGNVNITGSYLVNGASVASSQWVTTSTSIYYNSGNVGIGTTSPSQLLTVGNNNQFTVSSGGNGVFNGTLGVGMAANNGLLQVAPQWGTVNSSIASYGNSTVGYGTNALSFGWSTSYPNTIGALGSSAAMFIAANANLSASSTDAMNYTRTGSYPIGIFVSGAIGNDSINFQSAATGTLGSTVSWSSKMFFDMLNGRMGIGTVAPQNSLDVNGGMALGSYAGVNTAPSNGLIISGNVGIGTTSPSSTLTVNGTGWFSQPIYVGTPTAAGMAATKAYVDSAVTGGSSGGSFATINVTGNWTLSGAAQSSLNMNGNSITGLNKLTVTTIDPVYEIGGVKYATYGPESVGIAVTSDGKGRLSNEGHALDFTYTLDFDNAAKGSDLWLFRQTIDAGENLQNVNLTLTPEGGEANLWYDIHGNTIVVHGDHPVAFSYHLSAPRYDNSKWGNVLTDQATAPSVSLP